MLKANSILSTANSGVSKPSLLYMCGSKGLCSACTSCASSLVAVVIFFPLLSCTVTALILILGFFACSPASSGLVAACCCVVSFLLLLALPSCIWSSSDLLVVGGLLTGVSEVPSLIVVCAVGVGSPSVVCLFVSSVLAFFACVSPVGAGVVSSRCCVDLVAVTAVLSCDEAAWPCWSCVSACCPCSVLACGVGSGVSGKDGWNPSGGEGFHGVPFTVPNICLSYLASPASLLTVRARTTLPATPTKDSPVDVHFPSQVPQLWSLFECRDHVHYGFSKFT